MTIVECKIVLFNPWLQNAEGVLWSPNINSLPNNKFLDWSKLKALAYDKASVTEKWKFILGRTEYIMTRKGENAFTLKSSAPFFLKPCVSGAGAL